MDGRSHLFDTLLTSSQFLYRCQIILLGDRGTRFRVIHYVAVSRPRVEPMTSWLQTWCPPNPLHHHAISCNLLGLLWMSPEYAIKRLCLSCLDITLKLKLILKKVSILQKSIKLEQSYFYFELLLVPASAEECIFSSPFTVTTSFLLPTKNINE